VAPSRISSLAPPAERITVITLHRKTQIQNLILVAHKEQAVIHRQIPIDGRAQAIIEGPQLQAAPDRFGLAPLQTVDGTSGSNGRTAGDTGEGAVAPGAVLLRESGRESSGVGVVSITAAAEAWENITEDVTDRVRNSVVQKAGEFEVGFDVNVEAEEVDGDVEERVGAHCGGWGSRSAGSAAVVASVAVAGLTMARPSSMPASRSVLTIAVAVAAATSIVVTISTPVPTSVVTTTIVPSTAIAASLTRVRIPRSTTTAATIVRRLRLLRRSGIVRRASIAISRGASSGLHRSRNQGGRVSAVAAAARVGRIGRRTIVGRLLRRWTTGTAGAMRATAVVTTIAVARRGRRRRVSTATIVTPVVVAVAAVRRISTTTAAVTTAVIGRGVTATITRVRIGIPS